MSFDLKIINGDLNIKNADLEKVENSDKLYQEILKICITPIGANKFNPGYGSLLSKILIGSVLPEGFLIDNAKSQIRNSLENLQKLQSKQIGYQQVTAAEQLAAIQSVEVSRNTIDPRFFSVVLRVLAKDFKPLKTDFSVKPI